MRSINSPLISAGANISGEEPPVDETELRDNFSNIVDYIVPGKCNLKKDIFNDQDSRK